MRLHCISQLHFSGQPNWCIRTQTFQPSTQWHSQHWALCTEMNVCLTVWKDVWELGFTWNNERVARVFKNGLTLKKHCSRWLCFPFTQPAGYQEPIAQWTLSSLKRHRSKDSALGGADTGWAVCPGSSSSSPARHSLWTAEKSLNVTVYHTAN